MTVRIGISGWSYADWRGGAFYPKGLPQRKELSFVAGQFNSIEVNGTFYGPQKPATFERWRNETPEGFVFSIKGPRQITHYKRLRDIDEDLRQFLEGGILELGPKLGPILWQLPPSQTFDTELFDAFFGKLPRSQRHAVEIRNETFRSPDFIELLRCHNIALVCADTVKWPFLTDVTADFVYCRLHGGEKLYVSGYSDEALDGWAARVRNWSQGHDVFVYFDNTAKLRAPLDAKALAAKI